MPTIATTSPLWAEVSRSHRVRTRVEVWSGTTKQTTLQPQDGNVTIDATRAIRRNLDLTIIDPDGSLTPTSRTDLLAPFAGNEIRVWRGVTYSDGTTEEAPLGVFRITDVQVQRSQDGIQLSITGEDRAWWVSRQTFTSSFDIPDGTNIADAIALVLDDRVPNTPRSFASTRFTTPLLHPGIDGQTDPWAFCRDLANTAGMELYFDANGVATLAAIPGIYGDTVATFDESTTSGVMLDLSRGMSIETTPNGYRVTAESSIITNPWRSTRWDDDASSPTYRDPSLPEEPPQAGDVVVEQSTPYVKPNADGTSNTDQTDTMAAAMLQTVIGQPLQLTAVPNPALDARDRVTVTSTRLGVNTTAQIDSISMPLSADGTMTINARARRLNA